MMTHRAMALTRSRWRRFLVPIVMVHCASWPSNLAAQAVNDLRSVSYWQGPVSGSWFNVQLWEDAQPALNRNTSAYFDVGSNYQVYITRDVNIADLFLLDTNSTIGIDPRVDLAIFDRIVNNGRIEINTGVSSGASNLNFDRDTIISGHGTIQLNARNGINEAQIRTQGNILTIGRDQRLQGAGLLRGIYHNQGVILSNLNDGPGLDIVLRLTQDQHGILEVSNSSLRLLEFSSVTGGSFVFDDHSVLELFEGAVLLPDTVKVGSDTTVLIRGANVIHPFPEEAIDLLRIEGPESNCLLSGDMHLVGNVQIEPGGMITSTEDVSISGTGSIELIRSTTGQGFNARIQTDGTHTLTLRNGIDVVGSGIIDGKNGAPIVNETIIRTGTSADRIALQGRVVGGVFEANGGVVEIGNAAVIGSTFRTTQGGQIQINGGELINTTFEPGVVPLATGRTVSLSGYLALGGDFRLGSPSSGDVSIDFDSNPQLQGVGRIVMDSPTNPNDYVELIGEGSFPSGITVEGAGLIDGMFGNDSIITANHPTRSLRIDGIIDGGVYIADHARMVLNGDHYNGEYIARGGVIDLAFARIYDSVIRRTDFGDVRLLPDTDVEFDTSYAEVSLDVCERSEVVFRGTNEIHGHHLVLDSGQILLEDTIVNGSGTIEMHENLFAPGQPRVFVDSGMGVIDDGISIQGSGLIQTTKNGILSIKSELIANDPFAPLILAGNIESTGMVVADAGELVLLNDLVLSSASLHSINGGLIRFDAGDIRLVGIENHSDLRLDNGLTNVILDQQFINNGSVYIGTTEVGQGATMGSPLHIEIQGSGIIELDAIEGYAFPNLFGTLSLTLGSGQHVTGAGRLGGTIQLYGSLSPDGDLRRFDISRIIFHDTAELNLELDGTLQGDFDFLRMLVGGMATLGGTLNIEFADKYSPSLGDRWQIFQGGRVIGDFNQIETDVALGTGWEFRVVPLTEGAELVITCRGDRNGDGTRDFFDVVDFLNDFNLSDPEADLNADGLIDFFDVAIFIQEFQSECSS